MRVGQPSVPSGRNSAALVAKKWGQKHDLDDYTTRKVAADIDKGWEYTAVVAKLVKAAGTYSATTHDARTEVEGDSRVSVSFRYPMVRKK